MQDTMTYMLITDTLLLKHVSLLPPFSIFYDSQLLGLTLRRVILVEGSTRWRLGKDGFFFLGKNFLYVFNEEQYSREGEFLVQQFGDESPSSKVAFFCMKHLEDEI